MKDIKIEWLEDDCDCETCGWSSASGARVSLGGKIILEKLPRASCFGCDSWYPEDIYRLILEHLGYRVINL